MRNLPRFYILNAIGIVPRAILIAIFAIIGFSVQQSSENILYGIPFMLLAGAFAAFRGKSTEERLFGKGEWRNVTMQEVDQARALLARSGSLRRKASCSGFGFGGCFTVVLLAGISVAILTNILGEPDINSMPATIFVDTILLFIPLMLFGRINIWDPPNLSMKIDQMSQILKIIAAEKNIEPKPSLMIAKTDEGEVPTDIKMLIHFSNAPKSFIGVQVQVNINDVQGKMYPYTYCVLLAHPDFGLIDTVKRAEDALMARDKQFKKRASNVIVEYKRNRDVNVVVVRQKTTAKSGYYTNPTSTANVFLSAIGLANESLKQ